MLFSENVFACALKRPNGEFAWMREDIPNAVDELVALDQAILGGEVWLSDGQQVIGLISQCAGPPAIYHWETVYAEEPWSGFVRRCAADARDAVDGLMVAIANDTRIPTGFTVYFTLTWVDETEFMAIQHRRE